MLSLYTLYNKVVMRFKHILFFFILLFGISCDDIYLEMEKEPSSSSRTVLAYMVGSDLVTDVEKNIKEMISVATKENLNGGNLIVYYSWVDKKTKAVNGRLFEIKQDLDGIVKEHLIREYKNQESLSPQFMRSVISEVFIQYPAEGYGLIFSSHATNWLPSYETGLRSFGEEKNKEMNINEMAKMLRGDFHLDFIVFDACSMGSIECAYEFRDITDYYMASPSEVMSAGFPYTKILPCFFVDKKYLEKALGVAAKEFYEFYRVYVAPTGRKNPWGNISVVKSSELLALATITKEIITTAGIPSMLSLDLTDIQVLSYLPVSKTRFYDFEELMGRLATDKQKTILKEKLEKAVVSKYTTEKIYCSPIRDIAVETFSGLSVYPLQEKFPELNGWYKANLLWYHDAYPQ